MTYFPDLEPCTYFSFLEAEKVIAVGWLDGEHEFTTGPLDEDLVRRLCALAERPWQPSLLMGYHTCEICERPEQGQTVVEFEGRRLSVGASNIFIPGEGVVYAVPSMILHYILAHAYQPPAIFVEAVRRCPPMRSRAYAAMMLRNGPGTLPLGDLSDGT